MAPAWLPLMIVGIVVSAAATALEYRRQTMSAVFCGALASLLFVAVAVVCRMETHDRPYSVFVLCGLLLCGAGSLLLKLGAGAKKGAAWAAGAGMAVFLAGHAAYIGALVYRGYIGMIIALPLALLIWLALIFLVLRRPGSPKRFRGLISLKLLLASLLLGWSAALLVLNLPDSTYHLFLLGALGMLIYDIDTIIRLFTRRRFPAAQAAAFAAYAAGQLLIALSILFA
ncbi:MAG: lysoplasmalogenase family protein [Clostridia bacterium]|nr:lysoplasmalogenase family protein [Clostridia bacterium]